MKVIKDLSIEFLGVHCENPFFLASSPVGSNYEMIKKSFQLGWGGVYYKTVGIFIPNECSPRFDQVSKEETPWIGFKNMEQISDKPTELNFEYMYRLKQDFPEKVIVASIMGSNEKEWKDLAIMCDQAGVDLIEGNFSCPQMTSSSMGSDVGTNSELVETYTRAVTSVTNIPFIAKMTPNVTSMEIPALAAISGGAKGISAINTVKSITGIDLESLTAKPVVCGKSSISGYSGAAIKPIALRFITELMRNNIIRNYELSGIGGIETWRDAIEFLLLGCRNLQVTTSIMQYGYRIIDDLCSGLMHFMDEHGYQRLENFIGLANNNIVPAEQLNRNIKILPKFDLDKCINCGRCYVSCFDGAHQAIDWNDAMHIPILNSKCVGCHLCMHVCPVSGAIVPGEMVQK